MGEEGHFNSQQVEQINLVLYPATISRQNWPFLNFCLHQGADFPSNTPQRHPVTPPNHQTTNTTKHQQTPANTTAKPLQRSPTRAWSNPGMQNTHRIEGSSLTAERTKHVRENPCAEHVWIAKTQGAYESAQQKRWRPTSTPRAEQRRVRKQRVNPIWGTLSNSEVLHSGATL